MDDLERFIQWAFIIAGLLGSAIAFYLTKKDRDAGTYNTLAKTVGNLSEQVSRLEKDLAAERSARRKLAAGIVILIAQLRLNGIEPEWEPKGD